MTEREKEVLQKCSFDHGCTLRAIADYLGNEYQGGATKIVHRLQDRGYLDAQRSLTDKGRLAIGEPE